MEDFGGGAGFGVEGAELAENQDEHREYGLDEPVKRPVGS